jgi:hypothetical protein
MIRVIDMTVMMTVNRMDLEFGRLSARYYYYYLSGLALPAD